MAIVYLHRRNDTNEVFYIGISHNKYRANSACSRNPHWHNIVNKAGYTIEITHKDIIWEEACSIEKYLICFYGRKDLNEGHLVNMTDGGDGLVGYKFSIEFKKQKAEFMRVRMLSNLNPMKNPKYIGENSSSKRLEVRAKRSKTLLARSDKHHMKDPDFILKYKGSNNSRAKAILQFDKNYNFIKEYGSLSEASSSTNTQKSHICHVCKGNRKFAGGFFWKYKN
jgi:hypothetical protein